ncbi:MAG: hypothetical protein OEV00_08680 [Acidobacteriota bacterium]|nr:hypothetical protein [Acidobacteriota bacterium]MDH3785385.1 hypothetical protein [Acidobacteriota bacterium]
MTTLKIMTPRNRLAVLTLALACLALPSTVTRAQSEAVLDTDIHGLRIAVEELVILLRRQNQQAEVRGLMSQILALDAGIVSLDESQRELMSERAKVANDLATLRLEHGQTRRRMQQPERPGATSESLRGLFELQKERLVSLEQRRDYMDGRLVELRDTLLLRKLQQQELETLFTDATTSPDTTE